MEELSIVKATVTFAKFPRHEVGRGKVTVIYKIP